MAKVKKKVKGLPLLLSIRSYHKHQHTKPTHAIPKIAADLIQPHPSIHPSIRAVSVSRRGWMDGWMDGGEESVVDVDKEEAGW